MAASVVPARGTREEEKEEEARLLLPEADGASSSPKSSVTRARGVVFFGAALVMVLAVSYTHLTLPTILLV